jgi:hypothetical protein
VDEAGRSAVPVPVAVHGTVLHGNFLPEERCFAELADVNPLNRRAGLLGNEYEKIVKPEPGHDLHLRAARLASGDGPEGPWRIQADEIDAWAFRAYDGPAGQDDKGPSPGERSSRASPSRAGGSTAIDGAGHGACPSPAVASSRRPRWSRTRNPRPKRASHLSASPRW